jgi:hypothetical protein
VVIAMTELERIRAETRATIARVDKMLDRQSLPPLPPTEDRGLRWRRQAAEREAAKAAETERRHLAEHADRTRAIARAIVEEAVIAERNYLIDEMLPLLVVEIREEMGKRFGKLQDAVDEIKAARSFEKAVAKAGSVIDLPHKRVS